MTYWHWWAMWVTAMIDMLWRAQEYHGGHYGPIFALINKRDDIMSDFNDRVYGMKG